MLALGKQHPVLLSVARPDVSSSVSRLNLSAEVQTAAVNQNWEDQAMSKLWSFPIVVTLSLVLTLLLSLPAQSWAAEHITAKVVAEWPIDNPGVKKMLLRRVEFAPGASKELTVKTFDFCNATQGTWSLTNHADNTTTVYVAGSRWRMPPPGTKVTVANPGNVPAVQWVYRLIEK